MPARPECFDRKYEPSPVARIRDQVALFEATDGTYHALAALSAPDETTPLLAVPMIDDPMSWSYPTLPDYGADLRAPSTCRSPAPTSARASRAAWDYGPTRRPGTR
jgi:hypothetical protein